jgi:hypothetical protein
MDVSFAFFVRFTPWQFGVGWRRLASVTHRRLRRGRMLENIPHLKFIRVSYVARMETQLPLTRESRRPALIIKTTRIPRMPLGSKSCR